MTRKRPEPIDIRDALQGCFGFTGNATMKELRRQTGRSRQALWKHLRKLLLNGELVKVRTNRGWAYRPGPGWTRDGVGVIRGTTGREGEWWSYLVNHAPFVAYVNLAQISTKLIKRRQATEALANLWGKWFIFADFEGVESVSEAFADEMFVAWPRREGPHLPVPINMNPDVRYVVRRAIHLAGAHLGKRDD